MSPRQLGRAVLCCLLLAGAGSLLPLQVAAAPEAALYDRIAERLVLMRDVAAYKWLHDLPVADPARERVVIATAQADALRYQIRPDSAGRFFAVQIEAAKDVQQYWFDRWTREGGPASGPDLAGVLRPRLLALGEEILELAATQLAAHDEALFSRTVATEGLSAPRMAELYAALVAVARYPSRLDQILDTGVVRVGTTGDYAPFSLLSGDADYQGADIDLAEDLAAALGVRAVFIQTSWPGLLDDLAAGRYDIAMSGVSRTVERARVGYLSAPYFVGGKLPIARCEDKRRFTSLATIDQPDVRVIVNPGGTNEAFVDEHLRQAQKIVHADNRTIFEALAAGEGDVMITDSIEVVLQTRKVPGLCGTMGQTLTYQEKGYLLPRDVALKNFVDTWLSLRLADGTVDATLDAHLSR
ncbi:MAG TPA: gamma subclass chorismate mutase AroQ [Pseudomonadales bacterium]